MGSFPWRSQVMSSTPAQLSILEMWREGQAVLLILSLFRTPQSLMSSPGRALAIPGQESLMTLKADGPAWQPWPQSLSSDSPGQAVAGVEPSAFFTLSTGI